MKEVASAGWHGLQAVNTRLPEPPRPRPTGPQGRCSRPGSSRNRRSAGRARPIPSVPPVWWRRARHKIYAGNRDMALPKTTNGGRSLPVVQAARWRPRRWGRAAPATDAAGGRRKPHSTKGPQGAPPFSYLFSRGRYSNPQAGTPAPSAFGPRGPRRDPRRDLRCSELVSPTQTPAPASELQRWRQSRS